MAEIKKALKFALCLVPIAIAAGIFTGLYLLDTYSDDVIAEAYCSAWKHRRFSCRKHDTNCFVFSGLWFYRIYSCR